MKKNLDGTFKRRHLTRQETTPTPNYGFLDVKGRKKFAEELAAKRILAAELLAKNIAKAKAEKAKLANESTQIVENTTELKQNLDSQTVGK